MRGQLSSDWVGCCRVALVVQASSLSSRALSHTRRSISGPSHLGCRLKRSANATAYSKKSNYHALDCLKHFPGFIKRLCDSVCGCCRLLPCIQCHSVCGQRGERAPLHPAAGADHVKKHFGHQKSTRDP